MDDGQVTAPGRDRQDAQRGQDARQVHQLPVRVIIGPSGPVGRGERAAGEPVLPLARMAR